MIGTDLDLAAQLLRQGHLVAIPTETVYGLAGNALDTKAVSEIFRVKDRPTFDPLIVHLADFAQAPAYVREVPEQAQLLAAEFMPGPLTLLLPKRATVPDLVTSGSDRVAVRVPVHPLALQLLGQLDFPLAAPSANPFGYISPTTAQHVDQQLGRAIAYILDGGPCAVGLESTIVGFEAGQVVVYRKGGVAVEALEQVVGPVQVRAVSTSSPQAPGMLLSHYAPRVPLLLGHLPELLAQHPGPGVGVLSFQRAWPGVPAHQQVQLSPTGDLAEAARQLFAALRHLDQLGLRLIVAEPLPEVGLGRAVNDRLRRAAARE
jgi:L-threonylcarbamoyladenylate synthase